MGEKLKSLFLKILFSYFFSIQAYSFIRMLFMNYMNI